MLTRRCITRYVRTTPYGMGSDKAKNALPIDVLHLSTRAMKCLMYDGVNTIEQLQQMTDAQLLALPRLGRTTLREIQRALGRDVHGFPSWASVERERMMRRIGKGDE